MLLCQVGARCSQRPRQISTPAARKTSRTRYSSPRQRRSAQAPARWPIACSTSARSPACKRFNAPLPLSEPVFGAAVPDRRMPVLATLGQPPEPPIQQTDHLDVVQHPIQPRQRHQLLLVATARPAPVHPQQVAVDG